MALIACLECGNPISDAAKCCPSCGAPAIRAQGIVCIRVPHPLFNPLFFKKEITIYAKDRMHRLWSGIPSKTIQFDIREKTYITIQFGHPARKIDAFVIPGHTYSLRRSKGIRGANSYHLTEINAFDFE